MTLFAPTYVFMYEKNIVASLYGDLPVNSNQKCNTTTKLYLKQRLKRVKHAKKVYYVTFARFFTP